MDISWQITELDRRDRSASGKSSAGMEIDLVTVEGSFEVFTATFIPKGQINNLEFDIYIWNYGFYERTPLFEHCEF